MLKKLQKPFFRLTVSAHVYHARLIVLDDKRDLLKYYLDVKCIRIPDWDMSRKVTGLELTRP